MGRRVNDSRNQEIRRAALDHVLDLVMALPCSDTLVLRGSRLLRAWAGDLAREPADLDFVVLPDQSVPIDRLSPYPYVSGLDVVQQWPEYAGGAGQYDIWKDEEFHTRGIRVFVPPEGLRWDVAPDPQDFSFLNDLTEEAKRRPEAAYGILFHPDDADFADTWTYSYGDDGPGGIRLIVPWTAGGQLSGRVQVDIAFDEVLPEPPAWTRIPLAPNAERQLVVQAATPELSLAWKLLWLHTDSAAGDGARPKDLYDAVILAEDTRVRLSPRLLRRVMRGVSIDIAAPSPGDWSEFAADNPSARGSARDWLTRLTSTLSERGLAVSLTARLGSQGVVEAGEEGDGFGGGGGVGQVGSEQGVPDLPDAPEVVGRQRRGIDVHRPAVPRVRFAGDEALRLQAAQGRARVGGLEADGGRDPGRGDARVLVDVPHDQALQLGQGHEARVLVRAHGDLAGHAEQDVREIRDAGCIPVRHACSLRILSRCYYNYIFIVFEELAG